MKTFWLVFKIVVGVYLTVVGVAAVRASAAGGIVTAEIPFLLNPITAGKIALFGPDEPSAEELEDPILAGLGQVPGGGFTG